MVRTRLVQYARGAKMTRIVLGILVLATVACGGCVTLLARDFDNATLVGQLRLGSADQLTRTMPLPQGSARLIVAVPNYRCAPIDSGRITIRVRDSRGIGFREDRDISELVWSYGENSCNAIAYLEARKDEWGSSDQNGEMRMEIQENPTIVTVEVDASRVIVRGERNASIWFIYGDRVPARRIFGDIGPSDSVNCSCK